MITLPGNIIFNLDINKYNRDKQQNLNEGPPSGPQKSNQKQPALGPIKGILRRSAGEQNSENQENRLEEETPTTIPNYLPTPLPKKGVKFEEGVKEEDGKKGGLGQWVSATTQRTNGTNNDQRGGR